jgi:hypothetical protein
MAWPSIIVRSYCPVLITQKHKAPLVDSGRRAGLAQQHQCEQPRRLRLVGHQLNQITGEPDGVAPQRGPFWIVGPGVVDQVHNGQDRSKSLGQIGRSRDSIGDLGGLDLVLSPDESLRHR